MMSELVHLSGRVALVTGAGSGIGAATARLLAAHGATVFCTDFEPPAIPDSGKADPAGARLIGLGLDVRHEADWEDVLAGITQRAGRLDILVHSAGISGASPLA